MTTTTATTATGTATGSRPVLSDGSALTPYLVVADARAALAFYVAALGAVPRGEPHVSDDGRIGHAEVVVGGALLMLADEHPQLGLVGPLARGGVSTTLHLQVPDVDAAVARAVAAGAVLEREPADARARGRAVRPNGRRARPRRPPVDAAGAGGGRASSRAGAARR